MFRLVSALTHALDLADIAILSHSHRVAYIVLRLWQELGLDPAKAERTILAALLHDIGISSSHWRLESHSLFPSQELVVTHCISGSNLVQKASILQDLAPAILCHHDRWEGGNPSGLAAQEIPLSARLIHLADRAEVQIKPEEYILAQVPDIIGGVQQLPGFFWPQALCALEKLSAQESFWLDLATENHQKVLAQTVSAAEAYPLPILREIADLFATVIDLKSPFTAKHSHGVAENAKNLALLAGMSQDEADMMEIAGLLHDLGKLAVPDEILEYPGPLSPDQMRIMRQHTYHTYHLLDCLDYYPELREWAAFHHEKLDGSGYPFHLPGTKLSLGARVMAVADIFQALHEDRPYRQGLGLSEIRPILYKMADQGKIDPDLTGLLLAKTD